MKEIHVLSRLKTDDGSTRLCALHLYTIAVCYWATFGCRRAPWLEYAFLWRFVSRTKSIHLDGSVQKIIVISIPSLAFSILSKHKRWLVLGSSWKLGQAIWGPRSRWMRSRYLGKDGSVHHLVLHCWVYKSAYTLNHDYWGAPPVAKVNGVPGKPVWTSGREG